MAVAQVSMARIDLANYAPPPPSSSTAAAVRPPSATPAKPKGGARVLSVLLQAVVMAVALALFFIFAGVAAVVLFHLCIAGRALRRRRAAARRVPDAPHDAPGLSVAELKGLPSFKFLGRSPQDCAVCLEGFLERESCRALPACRHVFHAPCVDRWLAKTPACPICRTRVKAVASELVVAKPIWWV